MLARSLKWIRRGILVAILATGVAFIPQLVTETTAVTSLIPNILFQHNFHEVVPGELYRTGQMPNSALKEVIEKYNIKTVIDVRKGLRGRYADGSSPSQEQFLQSRGVRYIHAGLTGYRMPYYFEVERLLDAFKEAELPVLVQCTSGTHRSGVASTIWLSEFSNAKDEALIAKQLSVAYGFFSFERGLKSLFQGFPTIDKLVTGYFADKERLGVDLRTWAWLNLSHEVPEYEFEDENAYYESLRAKSASVSSENLALTP